MYLIHLKSNKQVREIKKGQSENNQQVNALKTRVLYVLQLVRWYHVLVGRCFINRSKI